MPFLLLILVVFSGNSIRAQMRFENIFGGTSSDIAHSICKTDNGYFITGETRSFGNGGRDIFISKVDFNGALLFFKVLQGGNSDIAYSVACTFDGGCVVTGETRSYGQGDADVLVVKFDSIGAILWAKTLGSSGFDAGVAVAETPGQKIIIAGKTSGYGAGLLDFYTIKLDSYGNLLWSKAIGGNNNEEIWKAETTSDLGHIFVGVSATYGAGLNDIYLLKLDENGNLLWSKTYGTSSGEGMHSIVKSSTNSFYLGGNTRGSGAGGSDYFITKIDEQGNLKWAKAFGGVNDENIESILLLGDNQIVVEGNTNSFGFGGQDVLLLSVDTNAALLWAYTYGGSGTDARYDVRHGPAITSSNDGHIIYAGGTTSFSAESDDIYLFKADENGLLDTCSAMPVPVIEDIGILSISSPSPSVISVNAIQSQNIAITDFTFSLHSDTVLCNSSCDSLNCNDNNPCTTDTCINETCFHNPVLCDDSNSCTMDTCITGNCLHQPVNCDDMNTCTTDTCISGVCFNDAIPDCINPCDTLLCDDNNLCTDDTCLSGICQFMPLICFDNDLCTADTCISGLCFYLTEICDDSDSCTTDTCIAGVCQHNADRCDSECEKGALVPGAFSPNSDGINDHLPLFLNAHVELKEFKIFNRWGETVFVSNDSQLKWDGSFKGVNQDIQVFVYTLYYTCLEREYFKSGNITLVK